jgi:hypothetical protein
VNNHIIITQPSNSLADILDVLARPGGDRAGPSSLTCTRYSSPNTVPATLPAWM